MTLAGWGKLGRSGSIASSLRSIKLPIISNLECERRYNRSGSPQFVPEANFLCAGGEEGRGMCNGDSGGPLISYRPDGRAQVTYWQRNVFVKWLFIHPVGRRNHSYWNLNISCPVYNVLFYSALNLSPNLINAVGGGGQLECWLLDEGQSWRVYQSEQVQSNNND